MWIMIAGPYRSGSNDPAVWAANLEMLNRAAIAGGTDDDYREAMTPLSLALVDRCDACLQIGGSSRGADEEVEHFEAAGRPVYRAVHEVPEVS